MRLFAHFHENPIKEQSQPCKDITAYTFNNPLVRLKPKTSSWTPPEGQHTSLDVFISKCRIDINNILSNHITSMHSNTSSEDRNAIKVLQERLSQLIKEELLLSGVGTYISKRLYAKSLTPISTIKLKMIQLLINKILSLLPLQN